MTSLFTIRNLRIVPGVEFGWDPVKEEATRNARGFGFADVIELFDGRTVWEIVDSRFDYGEVSG